jgi:methylthioribose-1-phosphate isomerase
MDSAVQPIVWREDELALLDQRLLPHRTELFVCRTPHEVAEAIRWMVVRGAPAIGVAAAYGMALAVIRAEGDAASIDRELQQAAELLRQARPTAVNLGWAIDRMLEAASRAREKGKPLAAALIDAARAIDRQDVESNRRIGSFGQELLGQQATVLTHCNAGALATAGYGTALGVIRAACEAGKKIAVFADETRPWMQGARLTAWELQQDGIDVTLITDNMAGHFFQLGTFDAVVVGADRIARNGDAANKIGTYTVAVLANAHQVPFYVAAPLSTVDFDCPSGAAIPIEERSADEVGAVQGLGSDGEIQTFQVAPPNTRARHPAFDVTPAAMITAIITDRGIARAPYEESLRKLRAQA